ncbi:MAG: hypothetical protein IKK33_09770 [Lachnospiraceae bacterium]|nr:hypothetical protein [Lachnospiraceae bacterium]
MQSRFDIVIFAFLITFLVLFGNCFVNFEREIYEEVRPLGSYKGYSVENVRGDIMIVTTLAEIEEAVGNSDYFAIKADKKKIKKTNYFAEHDEDAGFSKIPPFFVHMFSSLEPKSYDRLYIVELEDGNYVPVKMFGETIDFSEDTITLPIAKRTLYKNPLKSLTKVNEKYELAGEKATYWYVDATGIGISCQDEFYDAQDRVVMVNWIIIMGGVILYTIISTVRLAKKRERAA